MRPRAGFRLQGELNRRGEMASRAGFRASPE